MKRIAEIKARREHAFWKNRSVLPFSQRWSFSLNICFESTVWPPPGKSYVPHEQRKSCSRRNETPHTYHQPNWWNQWQSRGRRKGSKKKSKCLQNSEKQRLFRARAVRWAWTSIKPSIRFPGFIVYPHTSLRSLTRLYATYCAPTRSGHEDGIW